MKEALELIPPAMFVSFSSAKYLWENLLSALRHIREKTKRT